MTLDEAIAKYNNLANNERTCYPEEAQQLAEWLEELKSYRTSVFSGDKTQAMLKEEYCKAIDDFAESVKNLIADSSVIRFKDIDELSEQLRAGDEK